MTVEMSGFDQDDLQLLEGCLAGEVQAWRRFEGRFGSGLLRAAAARLRGVLPGASAAEAEDVVQRVLARLAGPGRGSLAGSWNSLREAEGDACPLPALSPASFDLSGRAGQNTRLPMRVTITARHIDHTPSIDAYAREKAGKLEHLFDGITSVVITLDVGRKGRDGQMAEFIAHVVGGGTCVAHAKARTLYEAIDASEAKLQGQLKRYKAKLRLR